MNEEIIILQMASARQEDDISRLSDELYTQQKEIADLRQEITYMPGGKGYQEAEEEFNELSKN